MGVPSFFAWWASRYPERILFRAPPYKNAVLYLDFNGGIHPAVRTDSSLELTDMPEAVCVYLDKIIKNVGPGEVWIAIDGVAPVAKMSQQRERRFKSAKESKHKRELAIDCGEFVREHPIDFNMISPATEFMSGLEESLCEYIRIHTKPGSKWNGIRFVLSGSCIPGEGEHKIMDEIRRRRSERGSGSEPEPKPSHNYIYGLDADLMFLTLLNDPHSMIVRENVFFRKQQELGFDPELYPYIYLDVYELRNLICQLLDPITDMDNLSKMGFKYNRLVRETIKIDPCRHHDDYYNPDRDKQRLIMDYAFICILLGNDFLPRLPCLKIRNGSLNDLIAIYKLIGWRQGDFLIGEDLTVNRNYLYHILGAVSTLEDEFMLDMSERREQDIRRFKFRLEGKTPYQQAVEEFDYVENQYRDTVKGGTDGWRRRYYSYHIGLEYRNAKEFQRHLLPMCESYIQGMNWVLQYYMGWHNNWTWHYQYDAAPTALDLFNAIPDLELDYDFQDTAPVEPYVQLLSILPPQSAKLLPHTLRPLMTDRDSPIHYMYPIKITLSLIGNKFWHECKPRMPLVDHQLLEDVVHAKLQYMTDDERGRNKLGAVINFNA